MAANAVRRRFLEVRRESVPDAGERSRWFSSQSAKASRGASSWGWATISARKACLSASPALGVAGVFLRGAMLGTREFS